MRTVIYKLEKLLHDRKLTSTGDDASLSRDDLPTMEEQLSEIGLGETVPASSNMPKDESLFRHIFELKSIVPYVSKFMSSSISREAVNG